jgi:S-DNA-T family DNA segregation ATPase FtsK/SpoIIIE
LLPGQSDRIVINEITQLGPRKELYDSRRAQKKQTAKSTTTDLDIAVQHLIYVAQQLKIDNLPSPWPDPLPEWIAFTSVLQQLRYVGWNGHRWVFTPGKSTVPTQTCPQCQRPLRSGAKFCGNCGYSTFAANSGTSVAELPPRLPVLPRRPWLTAVLGMLDDPANQRQIPFCLDLTEQDGQFVLVGAPGAGKESWLRTLVMSLAHTHAPDELHFCLIEFGGQALQVLKDLPHTMGLFTPLDEERIKRLLLVLGDSLEERKERCSKAGVDSLVKLRELQPGSAFPAIVVVVTGFSEFRSNFQDEQLQFTRLIREGGPYGIHIIIAGDRAGDIPSTINSVVSRKATLRLADVTEYPMVLGTSLKINKDQPIPVGRGWYGRPPLEFQTAEPARVKDELLQIAELQQTIQAMRKAVESISAAQPAWGLQLPEPVENLPAVLLLEELSIRARQLMPEPSFLSVPLGIDGIRMRPVWVNLIADGPDFLVTGSSQGGKTTFLWSWLLALAQANSPQEVQFILVSGRRNSLRPLQRLSHVIEYCRNADEFHQNKIIAKINAEIDYREKALSDAESTANLFPHLLFVCDDYDEFANTLGNEREVMSGLERLAKRGRDVNMHTIIGGPPPGMGVGYGDPVVRQLKLGRSGILLRLLEAGDQNPLGVRIRPADIRQMPPGRGFIVRNGAEQVVHIATPGEPAAVEQQVIQLVSKWKDCPAASWSEPEVESPQ